MTLKNPLSHYDKGFSNGLSVRGLRYLEKVTGNVFYVSSVVGNDNHKGTIERPLATWAAAVSLCTANNGDLILFMPGHAETFSAAAAVAMSKAGVIAASLGVGNDRAKFTFGTDTSASVTVAGQSCKLLDVIGIAAIDGLTQPFDLTGDDVEYDIEWRDGSSAIEAARPVLMTGVSRFRGVINYIGFTAGNACVNAARLVGCTDGTIIPLFYGKASTALVEFHTTACTNVNVMGYGYNSGTTDGSKIVVDTVTGSTWSLYNFFDGAAGATFSGSSGAAVASDDVSVAISAIAALQAEISGAAGIATFPAGAAAANGVSVAEVVRYIQENVIVGSGTALPSNSSIYDILAGANGIPTFPAEAAAANGVSIAEVVRFIANGVRNGAGTALATDKSLVDALGTDGSSVTDSAVSVLGAIGANNNNNAFDSSNVAENNNGSALERLEYIAGRIGGTADTTAFNPKLGYKVTRAAADVFDGNVTPIFTISGGRVLVTHLEAEVTVAAIDNTPSNTKFVVNPTVGTDRDMCAVLDVDSDELGTLYSITGLASDALQGGSGGGTTGVTRDVVAPEGTIDFSSSADAGTGGALGKFELWYWPLDAGATVAAA